MGYEVGMLGTTLRGAYITKEKALKVRGEKNDCVGCLEHTNIQAKLELETKPNVK